METGRIGFVGLGVMGGPMAGHLLAAGGPLTVYNRTASKADGLRAEGAKVAPSLSGLAQNCDVIILCVSRTDDVRQCLDGMANAKAGTLFIDHSTIAPPAAAAFAKELKERGHRLVDAPVTGGSMGAKAGTLTIFLGGDEADMEQAKAVIAPYTKRAERVGDAGAGQMAKMVNQIAVAGPLLGLCEALSFAKKAGLDLHQIRMLVGGGAAGSWAFENYGPKIENRDWTPGFSIRNQRKDFAYCKEAAKSLDAAIPGTELVDALLAKLEAQGHADWTTASLYEIMLELPG